jgi:putative transposase
MISGSLIVSPSHVYATLLNEGTYLASERTMYRLLAAQGEVRERRDQLTHPAYARPELLAC